MDDDIVEFSIAHNRKYSTNHLWYQEKDDRLMIGVSEYLAVEHGDVLRVVLPQTGLEVEEFGADMFSIWTTDEKLSFPSPFSGQIAEVNGEVEINPDIVNESAYDQGWIILLDPHEIDLETLLEPDEYIEYISEL
jgi:glycine cleavage system H protein|tara:strand:- start:16 stop:420 length:405 start_codon:yes stop_codon:yes gene_type:complete